MQNLGGLFCSICLDYFCKPVAAICGHSFCQLCLQQYYLHFDSCPICDTKIRGQKCSKQTSLSNFTENFLQQNHPQYLQAYENRIKQLGKYKQDRTFTMKDMITGNKVDIRDNNYVWRQGRIIRIISRVGEPIKFVKILYLDSQEKMQEELKITSQRLALEGFYTRRDDIPKFVDHHSNKKQVFEHFIKQKNQN